MTRPDLPWTPVEEKPVRDDFDGEKPGLDWCTIRTPEEEFYTLENSKLLLSCRPEVADSLEHSSMLLRRVEHQEFYAKTRVDFKTKKANEKAGLVLYRMNWNHYMLMKEKNSVVLYKTFRGKEEEIARIPCKNQVAYLGVKGKGLQLQFTFGEKPDEMKNIGGVQDYRVLADGNENRFNGPGIGMYATSIGEKSKNKAEFEWFEYEGE